jgi:thiol-disulfide isomerase/thioredoxin
MADIYLMNEDCRCRGAGDITISRREFFMCHQVPSFSPAPKPLPWAVCLLLLVAGGLPLSLPAASPSIVDVLKIKPVQQPVEYDQPTAGEAEQCTLAPETKGMHVGWFLRNGEGQLLRRFVDTNQDQKVDQWCYYKNGIEVYRDIDSNYNGTADQYRWLGTAGMRWGIDRTGNQRIDSWKAISAAEVSQELVWALKTADQARFKLVLLSEADLRQLELGGELAAMLNKKRTESLAGFVELARRQKVVKISSRWVHFGGGMPGLLPAGSPGAARDVVVLDNAAAVVENGEQHNQLFVGSLVQVGACWKLVDMPRQLVAEQPIAGGFFFQLPASPTSVGEVVPMGLSEAEQELVGQLELMDRQLAAAASTAQKAELNRKRADLIEQLVQAAPSAEQKSIWLRQLADTLSAAVQAGDYPGGVERLGALTRQLSQKNGHPDIAYVTIRLLSASYGESLQRPGADYEKIQQKWIADLTQFVGRFPASPDAAEAILQLAIALEFNGDAEKAIPWYRTITTKFARTAVAPKAAGAIRRLQSRGKVIPLSGTTLGGQKIDLATFRGQSRWVVVYYWASWCQPCKQDMQLLRQLKARHGTNLVLLGVNLDQDAADARKAVTEWNVHWPQLHEKGGMESRLANEMGVITLPTMLVIDGAGRVLHHDLHISKLEQLLGQLK